jgi:hypothetical protein
VHFATDLLEHVKAVKACADRLKFSASIDAANLALDIEKGDLQVRFQPRFFIIDPKKGRTYSPYLNQDSLAFVGWLPYFNKVWPIALDKVAFKAYAREHGLRTPDWWTQAAPGISDFLIKRVSGSLGAGMRGPFRKHHQDAAEQRLEKGDYYERFVEGRVAKIWYWDTEPVCMELQDFAKITGDGRHTIRELIEIRLGDFKVAHRWPTFDWIVRYNGKQLDTVLKMDETVGAGFRYNSLLDGGDFKNRNVLARHASGAVGDQLRAVGKTLWQAVPEEIRQGVLYTVDAVLDEKNQFWVLEMNPNPQQHPDAYPAMLAAVIERKVSGMPSLVKNPPKDLDARKGGLVWAKPRGEARL